MRTSPRWISLAVLGAAGCLDAFEPPEPPEPTTAPAAAVVPVSIAMPIEVMPTATTPTGFGLGFIESRTITVSSADAAALVDGSLYLRGHALAYRDGYDLTAVKASIQWDGGAWIPLTNPVEIRDAAQGPVPADAVARPIVIEGLDAIYRGIGGGFRSVALRVPVTSLCGSSTCVTGNVNHTLAFRWNGTDGTGSGYRIIELNLRTTSGADLLPSSRFAASDPATWTAPLPSAADVAAGDRLWHTRNLLQSQPAPAGHPIIASCSDCHADDGRDLEYYAYSNRSIETRARFHGLTATQGNQIASYIRNHPSPRYGRPWNPPYQPDRGRDAVGAAQWAAGAGLAAVQPETADLIDDLFPSGRATMQDVADGIRGIGLPAQTTNLRELPIQIQLPDWNSWLPEVHPVDLWGPLGWDGGDGGFDAAVATTTTLLVPTTGLAVADFDHDGRVDVAATQPAPGAVLYLHGEADGATTAQTIYMGVSTTAVVAADLTADGRLDLIAANLGSNDIMVRPQDATGGFPVAMPVASPGGPRALATGDWNGDGKLDVAAVRYTGNQVAIHLGNGAGGLAAPSVRGTGVGPIDLAAADFNSDGRLDLASVNSGSNQVQIFPGVGNGSLGAPTNLAVGANPQAIAVGDLDRDGRTDLVVANQTSGTLTVIRRTTTGGYLTMPAIAIGASPADVALVDLDHDLDLDVIVTVAGTNQVIAKLGDGLGGFPGQSSITVTGAPRALAVADMNLDGAEDLVVAASTTPTVTMVPAMRGVDPAVAPSVVAAYQNTRASLIDFDRNDATEVHDLPYTLGSLAAAGTAFVSGGGWLSNGTGNAGGYRTTRGVVLDAAVIRGYSLELVKRSLGQWVAVKYWELMHAFDLETQGPQVFAKVPVPPAPPFTDGEVLSWPMGAHQVVFEIAPHILAADRDSFHPPIEYDVEHDACRDPLYVAEPGCVAPQLHAQQLVLKGTYDSTAWYHLQMLLHAGARSLHDSVDSTSAVSPVDWPYAMIHVYNLGAQAHAVSMVLPGAPPSPWESARYLATMMKTYQMRDNGKGPALTGWSMRDVSPRLLVSNWGGSAWKTELHTGLDDFDAGLRLEITNGFLLAFDQIISAPVFDDPATPLIYEWPRYAEGTSNDRETWWRIDPSDHIPSFPVKVQLLAGHWVPDLGNIFATDSFQHSNDMWNALPLLEELGADPVRIAALRAWAKRAWPGPLLARTDWDHR